jgi:VWFA-related protein
MRAGRAALLTLLACAARAQEAPVFHATSELVLLDVQVVHNKTRTATGILQAKDFELSEDGARQEITVFGREQFPLSIVLLFDLTDSVRGVLRRLTASAGMALQHLRPEDEVAVMAYAASAQLVDGFTTDRQSTVAAIGRSAAMKSDEAAFFNEAVFQAARQLEQSRNPTSRRVILWLTDNLANAPSDFNLRHNAKSLNGVPPHTEDEAIRALHESGTVVTALLLKDPLAVFWTAPFMAAEASARKKYPAGDAHKYAEISGGISPGLRGKNVEVRLAETIDDLRSRYTIGYRPSESKPAGTFCRVRVALAAGAPLRPQEWRVLVREGYYRK